MEKQTGHTPTPLQGPKFPEEVEHVWSAFLLLNGTRGQGFSGPSPLSFLEIESWMKLTNNTLLPWEIEAIKRLDAVYLRVVNKHG